MHHTYRTCASLRCISAMPTSFNILALALKRILRYSNRNKRHECTTFTILLPWKLHYPIQSLQQMMRNYLWQRLRSGSSPFLSLYSPNRIYSAHHIGLVASEYTMLHGIGIDSYGALETETLQVLRILLAPLLRSVALTATSTTRLRNCPSNSPATRFTILS